MPNVGRSLYNVGSCGHYFQLFVLVANSGAAKILYHCLNMLATETSFWGGGKLLQNDFMRRILEPHRINIKAGEKFKQNQLQKPRKQKLQNGFYKKICLAMVV